MNSEDYKCTARALWLVSEVAEPVEMLTPGEHQPVLLSVLELVRVVLVRVVRAMVCAVVVVVENERQPATHPHRIFVSFSPPGN